MTQAKKIIDAKGLCCPAPVVKMAKEWRKAKPGDILEVISTDPEVKVNAKAWAECTGNKIIGITEKKGIISVLIKILQPPPTG